MPTAYARFGAQRRGLAGNYSRSWGTAPGTATVTAGPEFAIGDPVADLIFYYDGEEFLKLRDCLLVQPQAGYSVTSAPTRDFEILDRSWRWALAPRVYGAWNIELPNGRLYRTASPRRMVADLWALCGETNADVSALPSEPRPFTVWNGDAPVDEIDRICAAYGCVPFLDPITDRATVAKIGEGSGPPVNVPQAARTNARTIRPTPTQVRMISGASLFQTVMLLNVSKALEVDGSYQFFQNVSYRTDPGNNNPQFQDPLKLSDVNTSFVDPATGESQQHRELAQASVYRTYEILQPGILQLGRRRNFPLALTPLLDEQIAKFGDAYIQLGNGKYVLSAATGALHEINQTADPSIPIFSIGPFTGALIEKNTTDGGRLPAYVRGTFADERRTYANTAKKTRFPGSVSIDLENGLVHLGAPCFKYAAARTAPGIITPFFTVESADLELVAAYQVKLNGVPIRYEAFRPTSAPSYAFGEAFEHHEETVLEVVEFDASRDGQAANNRPRVDEELGYYLDAYNNRFDQSSASIVKYGGFRRFSLSGRLRSLAWAYSTTGEPNTSASWDCEASPAVIPWEERAKAQAQKQGDYQARRAAAFERIRASQAAVRKALK